MRRLIFAAAVGVATLGPVASSNAQFGNGFGNDPFNAYYGYYVPQQQSFAAQLSQGAVAGINLNAADRRASALAQRAQFQSQPGGLYDPSQFGTETLGVRRPLRPPTIIAPGQPSTAVPAAGYYSRTANFYGISGLRTGLPGTVARPAGAPAGRSFRRR